MEIFNARFTQLRDEVKAVTDSIDTMEKECRSLEAWHKHLVNRKKYRPVFEQYAGKMFKANKERFAEEHKPHGSAGYVLGGAEPMTQMVFRRVFKHIQKNVELFGATPHVFRHSYITTLAKANVDLKTIQRISGHANITTTLNVYTHTREEEIQEAGDKIGELLGK